MAAPFLGDMQGRDDRAHAQEGIVATASVGERNRIGPAGKAGVLATALPLGLIMRDARLFRPSLVLGAVLLALLASVPPTGAQERPRIEIVPYVPHTEHVVSSAFSPDGVHLVLGGRATEPTLKLWDVASGRLIRTYEGHSGRVNSVVFSSDGSRLISGSDDGTARLWDAATGRVIRTLQRGREGQGDAYRPKVTSVALSPDGTRILAGTDETIGLWDAESGALVRNIQGHTGTIQSVAFSPDGTLLLSGAKDKTIRIWDAATGQLLNTIEAHPSGVNMVAFSPDSTASILQTFAVWDRASGQRIKTSGGNLSKVGVFDSGAVNSVAASPAGLRVLSVGYTKPRLWDIASGALLGTLVGGPRHAVAFSPDGSQVVWDGEELQMWELGSGRVVRWFGQRHISYRSVAFSRDGTRVLSGSGSPPLLQLWDVPSGQMLRSFKGHGGTNVFSVAFSPDGTRLLSGADDGTVRLWDAGSGEQIRTIKSAPGRFPLVTAVFSPDGARILTAVGKVIEMWDAASGRLIRAFEEDPGAIRAIAVSPDGMRVLSCGPDMKVKLWDAETGKLIRTMEGHSGLIQSVTFSSDGTRAISGSTDTTVRVWNPATGELLAILVAARSGGWLAITPEGFFNASAGGTEIFSIVRGLNITTVDQVHQSLFNPDLVREVLASDPSGEVREAAKVINLEKVLDSGPAPSVAIASPAEGSQSATDLATVSARIEDRGKGVGRIEWRVNGITAAVAAKPVGSGPVYTVTRQLALDPGDNAIEVVAYNGSNLLASPPARTTVTLTGPTDKLRPKLHILAIGIDAYVDRGWAPPGKGLLAFAPLSLAVKDAKAFADSMKTAAAGLYSEVRVTLALDRDATRENLHKLVDKVATEVHPRDSFFLFAAGHGYSLNGRFYLIAQDHQGGTDPKALAARAIRQDDLQDWLANRIKARKALILLDTCESGALIAGHLRSRPDAPTSEAGVGRLHEATGRPVLTAAAKGQFAYEGLIAASGERHGVFTWAVLDALRKGDSNGNGTIELSELVAHVQSAVPAAAATVRGRGQAVISVPAQKQSARFGSRGEDFVVAQRLQ
jgi:WD40 repeat protein